MLEGITLVFETDMVSIVKISDNVEFEGLAPVATPLLVVVDILDPGPLESIESPSSPGPTPEPVFGLEVGFRTCVLDAVEAVASGLGAATGAGSEVVGVPLLEPSLGRGPAQTLKEMSKFTWLELFLVYDARELDLHSATSFLTALVRKR